MKLGILRTDAVRPELKAEYGEYPVDIDEVDAYLITGSKSSVYEDKRWIIELMEFVRELNRRHKKLLGFCFGHQLVAQALGGKTERSAKGWGVGLHTHRFTTVPSWHDQGDVDLNILVSHQDQVVAVPDSARVLAGSEFCENAVCQIGDHILTFQGHPEFVPQYSRELLSIRRERIGEAAYAAGVSSLSGIAQGQRVGSWVLNFLYA